ncbi:MAG: glycerol-3-phosphate dehydrogenase/oxidase [Planctomycetaceae bacterium]|nr:glycerol-3-phosphate dehydrogenase/oxidase [Planctomycetaceae bacterium]
MNRSEVIGRLQDERLDVLVVGGGIVGAGIARDAAMRGLRIGLAEQADFASGTSSRSSRLLHGGLRYLEQGRIGLVREASLEKKILHRIAPHLSRPLGFVFPAYRHQGRPLWQLRIGVRLYDLLCSGRNFRPSRGLSRSETLESVPGLNSENLSGAALYYDALTNDARLVIDTLRSAERHGAALLNYCRFHDAHRTGNTWQVEAEDVVSGAALKLRAATIINATGPWADRIPHSGVHLRLSKGVHIVLHHSRLPVSQAVVITEGRRILFVIPWSDRVIVGTTDTDYYAAPEEVRVEADDLSYLLETLRRFFPEAEIGSRDIITSWAGLRPLVAEKDGAPSDISRAHQITSPEPGWWDVAGGKLTTYRLMAQQTVNEIVRFLNVVVSPCRTAEEPLLPAVAENKSPDGPVAPGAEFSRIDPAPWSAEAVRHFVTQEWAVHAEDVLLRRSGWQNHDRLSRDQVEQVVTWMAEAAGWCRERFDAERIAAGRSVSC